MLGGLLQLPFNLLGGVAEGLASPFLKDGQRLGLFDGLFGEEQQSGKKGLMPVDLFGTAEQDKQQNDPFALAQRTQPTGLLSGAYRIFEDVLGVTPDERRSIAGAPPRDAIHAQARADYDLDRRQMAMRQQDAAQRQANLDRRFDLDNRKFEAEQNAPPAQTTLVKNAIAAGLQPNTPEFRQFVMGHMKKGPLVSIGGAGTPIPEFNKLPAGFVYQRGPDGRVLINEQGAPTAIPIPGGPVDIAAQEKAASQQAAQQNTARSGNIVIEDIDRAINLATSGGEVVPTTGLGGFITQGVPGTDAHALSKTLDTVKANAAFDKLQQMRDASPTGGALGQVSERELNLLQSAIGSLEQSQDTQTLVFNLERVKGIYRDIIDGPQAGQSVLSELPAGAEPLGNGRYRLPDGRVVEEY